MMQQRYGTEAMTRIWSPESTYDRWRSVLSAYSRVRIPVTAIGAVRDREAEIGHDVAAYLDWARAVTGVGDLGAGLTSSNLVDTALSLAIIETNDVLVSQFRAVGRQLDRLWATQNERLGLTHGRPAEVDTIGRQFGLWGQRVGRATTGIAASSARYAYASFGGPIGDYYTGGADRARALDAAETLGLLPDGIASGGTEQALPRDRIAGWAESVSAGATALAFVATQIRLGARDGELREPTGVIEYKGSSSMPHKRNPTRSERIVGLERVVRALAGALTESVIWWDLRDISHSSVERVCLPQIAAYTDFMATELASILAGLELDFEVMDARVVAHRGSADAYAEALRGGTDPGSAYAAAREVP